MCRQEMGRVQRNLERGQLDLKAKFRFIMCLQQYLNITLVGK